MRRPFVPIIGALIIGGAVIGALVHGRPQPPLNTVAPLITGTDQVGTGTLQTSIGTWVRNPTSFTYQWQRADNLAFTLNVVTGIGAASTYSLVVADDAKYHRVLVTATNSGGSTTATSSVVGPTSTAGAGLANIWLNTTAGATPTRCATVCSYNPANAYGSFDAARGAASPGDLVLVNGSVISEYPLQEITRKTALLENGPGVVTFRNAPGQSPWVSRQIDLGPIGTCCTSGPSYIVFDGINIDGCLNTYDGTNGPEKYVTFKNAHVQAWNNGCHNINLDSTDHFTIGPNVEVGYNCCNNDTIGLTNQPGAQPNSNLVITGVYAHDAYDACWKMPSGFASGCDSQGYGDASHQLTTLATAMLASTVGASEQISVAPQANNANGSSYWPQNHGFYVQVGAEVLRVQSRVGDTWNVLRGQAKCGANASAPAHASTVVVAACNNGYDHVDGIHAWGCNHCDILNSQFYALSPVVHSGGFQGAAQGIFMEQINSGFYADMTFQNVMVACGCGTNVMSMGSAPHVGGNHGYFKFINVSVQGNLSLSDTQLTTTTTGTNTLTGATPFTITVADVTAFKLDPLDFGRVVVGGTQIATCISGVTANNGSTGSLANGPGTFLNCTGGTGTFNAGTQIRQSKSAFDPGTQITFSGVIAQGFIHSGSLFPPGESSTSCFYGAWDDTRITPSFDHNKFAAVSCSPTDLPGPVNWISTDYYTPDFRLVLNGQNALTGGGVGGNCPPDDSFGNPRPGPDGVCAMGGYEPPS